MDYLPGLPNVRGNRGHTCIRVLIVILLIVGFGMVCYKEGVSEAIIYLVMGTPVGLFTIVLLHVALRGCWLIEELCQNPGQYPDKMYAVQKAFTFNMKSLCTCTISTMITLLVCVVFGNPYVYLWNMGSLAYVVPFLASVFFSQLIEMEECTLHTSIQIEKMKGLDYGSGMAYNFFYGYLRLILPECGMQATKGIKKRIETFANRHKIGDNAFPVKKLFLLIPQNLYTPTDLKDVSTDWPHNGSSWMEAAVSLEAQEFDRAGVKQRAYKNSVYKIHNRDSQNAEPIYVVAEGATPLKTFHEVITMNAKMSCIFKDHQNDIVSAFYKTLQDIVRDSSDCRDVCEIIYYVDAVGDRKVNVARIILERIQQLTGRGSAQRCGS